MVRRVEPGLPLPVDPHRRLGASWEGYVVQEVISAVAPDEAHFWATHNGAELDLLLFKDGRRVGVECKRMDAPRLTPSMRNALADLDLDHLVVVYPGARAYPLAERVTVLPLGQLTQENHDLSTPGVA